VAREVQLDCRRPRPVRGEPSYIQEFPMNRLRCHLLAVASGLIAAIVLGVFPLSVAQAQEKEGKEQPASFWMKKKLDYSQNILAGIATADFDKIVQNAQSMRSLNKIESFIRGRTPGYRNQLQIFEVSLDEIIRQAQKDNVDGAALAFTQLTISCVNCHKQLRETK
jgi:soluble cytochrome b562